ncbi:MAG: transposase [Lachnospiraceae bacterium]|nr:transposase [Lachnospiraceae bacterium]
MSTDSTITKTVWQYSQLLPDETMEFLRGIALDYNKVKNYTYKRYSGIRSLGRLTPVFDIMSEVRHSGIRTQLGLPSAYFDPAIVDAVADIKGMWGILKNKLGTLITANENLSDADRIYLRTVLKLDKIYAAVLCHEDYEMPKRAKGLDIDAAHLNNLLCRMTRKHLTKPETGSTDHFSIAPCGYAYRDGAIYIASRKPGQRVALPLKDDHICSRQIRLCIKKDYAALAIPVETKIRKHKDYSNTVYIHIGYQDMFTLSNGNIYGQSLGSMTSLETQRLTDKNRERAKLRAACQQSMENGDIKKADNIEACNLGTEKYNRQKEKERAKTETFINTEINRMLAVEKPGRIVITRPVTINKTKLASKSANRNMTRNFNGYVRERLSYKCRVHAIELVQINSKGTGSVCSRCGAEGKRMPDGFYCPGCGYEAAISLNGARNIENILAVKKTDRSV